jgi:hypothetical protein
MAGLAVFMTWTLIRSFRQGVIYDDGRAYEFDARPMMFGAVLVSRVAGIALFVGLAAGYTFKECLRIAGVPEIIIGLFG